VVDDQSGAPWIPVYVPVEMAADVLHSVASFVEGTGPTIGRSDWSEATADDLVAFLGGLQPLEWRLIRELADREVPTSVAELADALDVEMSAVAGAMGPVNKRAKREGWAPPIEPRRFTPPGNSVSRRGLLLAAGVRAWVKAHPDAPGA
jgi:hypothetical protein